MKRTVIQQLTLDVASSAVGRNALLSYGVSDNTTGIWGQLWRCQVPLWVWQVQILLWVYEEDCRGSVRAVGDLHSTAGESGNPVGISESLRVY